MENNLRSPLVVSSQSGNYAKNTLMRNGFMIIVVIVVVYIFYSLYRNKYSISGFLQDTVRDDTQSRGYIENYVKRLQEQQELNLG